MIALKLIGIILSINDTLKYPPIQLHNKHLFIFLFVNFLNDHPMIDKFDEILAELMVVR